MGLSTTPDLVPVILTVERWGVRVGELARRLGKSAGTVSRWVTRGLRRRTEEAAFASRLEHIEAVLRERAHDGAWVCQLRRTWYLLSGTCYHQPCARASYRPVGAASRSHSRC